MIRMSMEKLLNLSDIVTLLNYSQLFLMKSHFNSQENVRLKVHQEVVMMLQNWELVS